MKKTIILSETDLKNIIKKVLNKKTYIFEQSSEGCIKGDCQNGEGTFVWDDGVKYVGTFKNGNREGKGTEYYNNVKVYEGDWKNNRWEGKGKRYDIETKKLTYVGQFKNGYFEGQGTYYHDNGGKYVGQFKEDMFNGQGTRYYIDGAKYVGQWKEFKFNGQGTYTNPHLVSFSGKWINDKLDGKDTGYYDKQLTNSTFLNTTLTGEGCIKGNCSNGWGVQVLPDGNGKYSGNFKNEEYNGSGTYTNKYGVSFKGNWVDGYLDGIGVDNLMFIKSKKEYDCKSYLEKKRQDEKFYYYSKKEDVKKFKEEHTGAQFVEDSPYKCEADGKTYYFVKVKVQKNVDDNTDDKNTNTEKENTYNENVDPATCTQPTDIKYQYPNDKYWRYAISPEGCWWAKKDRPGTPNDGKWFNLSALAKDNPTKYNTPINNLNTAFTNKTLIDVTNNNNNDDDGGGATTEIDI